MPVRSDEWMDSGTYDKSKNSQIEVTFKTIHGARHRGAASGSAPYCASGSCRSYCVEARPSRISEDGVRKAGGVYTGLRGNGVADVLRKSTTRQRRILDGFYPFFANRPVDGCRSCSIAASSGVRAR